MGKKLASRGTPQVSTPSVILLLFQEAASSSAASSGASSCPAGEPAKVGECEVRLPVEKPEEDAVVPAAEGTAPKAADLAACVSRGAGICMNSDVLQRGGASGVHELFSRTETAAVVSSPTSPASLSGENFEGPVVPEEMEATLRDSHDRALVLCSSLRRLGQTIQPGMEVNFSTSGCTPSGPRASNLVVPGTRLEGL